MRVLIVSYNYPLPEDHGSTMRTMNFVRFFLKHGKVDIAYKKPKREDETHGRYFSKEYFIQPETDGRKVDSIGKRLSRFVRCLPWLIDEAELQIGKKIASLIESEDYDYILVRYLYNMGVIQNLSEDMKKRIIFDCDDVVSSLLCFYPSEDFSPYARVRRKMDHILIRRYERRCLRVGAALFCSNDDVRKVIRGGDDRNYFVVPNVYQNEAFRNREVGEGFGLRKRLLFVGALDYRPNIMGLSWFLETIYPVLKRAHPDLSLQIIGRTPSPLVLKLSSQYPDVALHADVPDVRPYYERCGAVIVPLLAGGGTRIKILEAGMAQRPVLSTPLGAYGLDMKDGMDLLHFTDAETCVRQYERLFDREFYERLTLHLRKKVVSGYSTAAFETAMNKVLDFMRDLRGK